jgi:hypothetical protein
METHAQELHKLPGIGWKHYFFEFFMLFLAVFCGFLAENAREHVVERNRANEYAQNLCDELKKDTATLNHLIAYTHTLTGKLDTLSTLANEKSPGTSNGRLYWYSNFAAKLEQFSSGSSTIEQLKSSGNLRIMKTNVAQKITGYDKLIKLLANDYALSRAEYETMNQLRLKIFDFVFAIKFHPWPGQRITADSIFKLNPPLLKDDPKLMKEFANWVTWSALNYRGEAYVWLEPLNKSATELIALQQKEYHLENE